MHQILFASRSAAASILAWNDFLSINLTLAKNTIHNPDEPRHYMKLTPK